LPGTANGKTYDLLHWQQYWCNKTVYSRKLKCSKQAAGPIRVRDTVTILFCFILLRTGVACDSSYSG